ncbi:ubiquitin-like-specific protease ESD4 [Coffea arabica]|uniref:Ubiquitin-like-specific protease ESD4 n=1 Tax=Coffea arabica TaxID=13443 RepID=A0A6P6VFD6_COFAR|nr:uncharacterized protein LOC113720872 [Coffea arabica]
MSSNLTNEYKVKKQTPSRAHERKPKGLAGRVSVYTQRRNEARRRAEGALETIRREGVDNCKTASAVVHDFLMNMTLPLEQAVVTIRGQVANREHILCLLPCMGVEAEIVNCYSALLTARARRNSGNASYRVWYMPSWSAEMVTKNEMTLDELYIYYLTENKFGGLIMECEKICIPLNWDGKHWYLAVIYMKENKVMIFDPFPDEDFNELRLMNAKVVCSKISGALYTGYGENFSYDFNDFEYLSPSWCPRQINKWDSAMFVMKYMEVCDEMEDVIKIEIISNQARRSRAIELFVDASNEARQTCVDEFEGLQEIFQPVHPN